MMKRFKLDTVKLLKAFDFIEDELEAEISLKYWDSTRAGSIRKANKSLKEGYAELLASNFVNAEEKLHRAIQHNLKSWQTFAALAELEFARKNWSKVLHYIDWVESLSTSRSDLSDIYEMKLVALLKSGFMDEAQELLEEMPKKTNLKYLHLPILLPLILYVGCEQNFCPCIEKSYSEAFDSFDTSSANEDVRRIASYIKSMLDVWSDYDEKERIKLRNDVMPKLIEDICDAYTRLIGTGVFKLRIEKLFKGLPEEVKSEG